MKTIEQDIIKAVRERKNLRTGNANSSAYALAVHLTGYRDCLEWDRDKKCFRYKLWGHLIFQRTGLRTVTVSDCGYATPTTVSRINALFAALDIPVTASVRKENTVWFLHGEYIPGGTYDINGWHITLK
jgi:hypothetical protein